MTKSQNGPVTRITEVSGQNKQSEYKTGQKDDKNRSEKKYVLRGSTDPHLKRRLIKN